MAEAEEKPSIVFITTDTQGQNMVSAYGKNPAARTPSIDRLASTGVLFENSYCSAPVCTPARSTWYSGLPPNRNGAFMNALAFSRHLPLLGDLMTGAGYRCFHLGKWHLDAEGYAGRGFAQAGFDKSVWYDQINFLEDVGREGVNRFGGWNKGLEDEAYCFGHRVAERAIGLMRQHGPGAAPLFLAVDFDEPHGPYICPPPFRGRNKQADLPVPSTFRSEMAGKPWVQRQTAAWLAEQRPTPDTYPRYYHKYYDCNEYVDYEIGRVAEAARTILGEETVIIYTSDHGDHLGQFGLQPKGPTMYEATAAVPLIISAPRLVRKGGLPLGSRCAGLVGATDVWRTILDFAGVAPKEQELRDPAYTGRSVVPVLEGKTDSVREEVVVEYTRFGVTFDQVGGFFPIRCIRSGDWKLAVNLFDTDELYNLAEDPDESVNRIEDSAAASVRNDLHDRLLSYMSDTRDLFRGRHWGSRSWRPEYSEPFAGLQTTGIKDDWDSGSFFD